MVLKDNYLVLCLDEAMTNREIYFSILNVLNKREKKVKIKIVTDSLQYNDLLFNRTNSKELVGKTAVYKGEMEAIYAGYLVRITPVLLDSDYLNYIMQSQYYWNYCQSVRSDAIGQSNINAENKIIPEKWTLELM